MLEIVKTGLSRTGGDRDIFLSCWDKSSPLIKELERTVDFAERKCGDLMQQLHFYKQYYEKWAQVERVNPIYHKKKIKKCCRRTSDIDSSSENEFEKANQYLYKKIKSKINEMGNEITLANRKIHLRNENVPSLPKNDSPLRPEPGKSQQAYDPPSLMIESKSEPTMTSCNAIHGEAEGVKITEKQSSNSVPTRDKISKNTKKDRGPARRRFSNLQRYKIRSKSLPQGVRRKFGFGGFIEVFEPERIFGDNIRSMSKSRTSLKANSLKSFKSRKSKTKLLQLRKPTPKSSQNRIAKSNSDIKHAFKNGKCELEMKKNESNNLTVISTASSQKETKKDTNACKALVPSIAIPEINKTELALNDNLKNLIAKPNSLLPFLRHPIPFIPCSSTSKSYNLGLNVQQVLSLIKHKRHSVTLQAIVRNGMRAARSVTEPSVNTLFISQTTTSHSHVTSTICPAREGSEDGFSVFSDTRSKCTLLKQVQTMRSRVIGGNINSLEEPVLENNKPERPEDVWVVEQPDPNGRQVGNSRSKCTCFPLKHCVDYHKVLRQYTGWRLPSDSRVDPRSPYPCPKSKLYPVRSRDNFDFNREEKDGRIELMKVHNDLLNLTRKYSSLQEQISQNCLDDQEAIAELDAMESELAIREIEFKDILNFYNQLMSLKDKLKSLRSHNRPVPRHPGLPKPKRDPLAPTPSMALAKVLKKIQGLQDKIKLIDAP